MTWFPNPINQSPRPARFNPRPVGQIRPGSATADVLAYLRLVKLFQRKDTIVRATGRTARAVDWALIFLRREGLVIRGEDPRNPRYRTYKAVGSDK